MLAARFMKWIPNDRTTAIGLIMRVFEQANARELLPIIIDPVDIHVISSGAHREIDPGSTAEEALNSIGEGHSFEWWFEPEFVNNQLRFRFHAERKRIYDRRGVRGAAFHAGYNCAVNSQQSMVVDRPPVSTIVTFSRDGEVVGEYTSDYLYETYGHWEGKLHLWAPTADLTWEITELIAQGLAGEIKRFQFEVFPNVSDLSKSLRPGSVHNAIVPDIGFTNGNRGTRAVVRVIAMSYDESDGRVKCVAEVVTNTEILNGQP